MKEKICVFIVENSKLIREIYNEVGQENYIDEVFNLEIFEQLCDDLNTHTVAEEGYVLSLTDDKCELICKLLRKSFDK